MKRAIERYDAWCKAVREGAVCVTCEYWAATVGDQCESCSDG